VNDHRFKVAQLLKIQLFSKPIFWFD